MPDITLVPKIANFFGVSADYLLGIKADENEEKIKEYFDKPREEFGMRLMLIIKRDDEILKEFYGRMTV